VQRAGQSHRKATRSRTYRRPVFAVGMKAIRRWPALPRERLPRG